MSDSNGLTNVICPNGYRYAQTVPFKIQAGNMQTTMAGPYCVADPYKTNTIIPPPEPTFGTGGNQTANLITMAQPIGICPYGDLVYNTNDLPMCVISMDNYQSKACKYGVLSTTNKTDSDGRSYKVTTCKAAP